MLFFRVADVYEWYGEAADCFRVEVNVQNSVWGLLFGYKETFQFAWSSTQDIPPETCCDKQKFAYRVEVIAAA